MEVKKILVVDDDPVSLHLLERITLSLDNTVVFLANNGRLAYEAFCLNNFDLVLSDYQMPELDGIELLQKIKSEDPSLPVIICTAYGDTQTVLKAKSIGAFDFFNKPIDAVDLKKTIEIALSFGSTHATPHDSAFQKALQNFVKEKQSLEGLDPSVINNFVTALSNKSVEELISKCKAQAVITLNKINEALFHKKLETAKKLAFHLQGSAKALGLNQIKILAMGLTKVNTLEDAFHVYEEINVRYFSDITTLENYLRSKSETN